MSQAPSSNKSRGGGGVLEVGGVADEDLGEQVAQLDDDAFRQAFENRAPYTGFARRIPVSLLIEKDTVLEGLAAIARVPDAYAIDYGARAWR